MSIEDASRPVSCTEPYYAVGLLERVCLVPCPRCGAERDERCIGQYGRRTKSTHCARRDAAKDAGYLMGRFRASSHATLGRVRQLHHELLAIVECRYKPQRARGAA